MIARIHRRLKGGFTLIELMIVVAIIGVLAAVAIPAFMKYVRKSKTTEAVQGVKKIYEGARQYFLEESNTRGTTSQIDKQYPASASAETPAATQCCAGAGDKCTPSPALWSGSWQDLHFSMDDPHYYTYNYVGSGTGTSSTYSARARGDLDCDTTYSTFEMVGSVASDGSPTGMAGLYRNLELE